MQKHLEVSEYFEARLFSCQVCVMVIAVFYLPFSIIHYPFKVYLAM